MKKYIGKKSSGYKQVKSFPKIQRFWKTDVWNNRDTRFSYVDENKKTESGFPIAVRLKYAKTCFWLFSLPACKKYAIAKIVSLAISDFLWYND